MSSLKERYKPLEQVLKRAWEQAAEGKGSDRHTDGTENFSDQQICSITRMLGTGFPLGQATKKIFETENIDLTANKVHELLGAINYIAACVIVLEET